MWVSLLQQLSYKEISSSTFPILLAKEEKESKKNDCLVFFPQKNYVLENVGVFKFKMGVVNEKFCGRAWFL